MYIYIYIYIYIYNVATAGPPASCGALSGSSPRAPERAPVVSPAIFLF